MKVTTALAFLAPFLAVGPLQADMIRDRSGKVTATIEKTETGAFVRDRSGKVTAIIETTKSGSVIRDRSGKRIAEVPK